MFLLGVGIDCGTTMCTDHHQTADCFHSIALRCFESSRKLNRFHFYLLQNRSQRIMQ